MTSRPQRFHDAEAAIDWLIDTVGHELCVDRRGHVVSGTRGAGCTGGQISMPGWSYGRVPESSTARLMDDDD